MERIKKVDQPPPITALPWYREINRRQWGTLLGVWSVWVLDAFDFIILTFVLSDIAHDFHQPLSNVSLLILAAFGVRWAGGLFFGDLSDRIGRKRPLLLALLWFTAGGALTGLAWNFASILAFRLLLGFGMAPIFALGSTIIAETWPERQRSIGIGILDAGWGVGGVLAALAYALIYPHFGWRMLFFVGVLPGIVLAIILYRALPEVEFKRDKGRASGSPALRLFVDHPRVVLTLALLLMAGQFAAWPLQGLLPTFLKEERFDVAWISWVSTASSIPA